MTSSPHTSAMTMMKYAIHCAVRRNMPISSSLLVGQNSLCSVPNIRNSRSACCRVLGEHNDTSAWFRRLFSLCN